LKGKELAIHIVRMAFARNINGHTVGARRRNSILLLKFTAVPYAITSAAPCMTAAMRTGYSRQRPRVKLRLPRPCALSRGLCVVHHFRICFQFAADQRFQALRNIAADILGLYGTALHQPSISSSFP
jgi:hypothetical protein